jgi:hypothetical protein
MYIHEHFEFKVFIFVYFRVLQKGLFWRLKFFLKKICLFYKPLKMK